MESKHTMPDLLLFEFEYEKENGEKDVIIYSGITQAQAREHAVRSLKSSGEYDQVVSLEVKDVGLTYP